MKLKKLNILMAGLVAVVVFSCSKDEDPSRTSLLLRKWGVVKYEIGGIDVTDQFSEGECENDDYTEFKSDGTFFESTGTEKCYVDDDDDTGVWQWKENETVLSIQYSGEDPTDWDLVSISASVLKVKQFDEDEQADLVVTLNAK